MKPIIVFLFLCFPFYSFAQTLVSVENDSDLINIGKRVLFFEDKSGKLSFQDILEDKNQLRFIKNESYVPNFANTSSVIWCKFTFNNETEENCLLEIANPTIQKIEFYSPNPDGKYQVQNFGSSEHYHKRYFKTNYFLMPLASAATPTVKTFYIRFQTDYNLEIPMQVGTIKAMLENHHQRDTLIGMYFGLMFIMICYNLFLYFAIRDAAYLYYVATIFLLFLLNATLKGHVFGFIGAQTWLSNYLTLVPDLMIIFVLLFSSSFLETKKNVPYWHAGLYAFIALSVGSMLLSLLGYNLFSDLVLKNTSLLSCLYLIIIAGLMYKKGFMIARFYILAWGTFLICNIIYVLYLSAFLPANVFTSHASMIGSVLEVLLLSFALADKITLLRKQKQQAQESNFRLITQQNKILEQKVNERTTELKEKNEEIASQNEELKRQQETMLEFNDRMFEMHEQVESTFQKLKYTSDRLGESIRYAQHIQQVVLPESKQLKDFFTDYFAIYLPKDTVSGDFYWFTQISENQGIFVLADCTGHGVPGAFMSMIGSTILYETIHVKKIISPSEILLAIHEGVKNVLKQSEGKNSDGMDAAICLFEKNEKNTKIIFSGAKLAVFYTKNQEIVQISGDKISIGGRTEKTRNFSNYEFVLNNQEILYLTTDGYVDQVNGQKEKLGSPRFKQLILDNFGKSFAEQQEILQQTFFEHQKEEPQRDDVSVIALKM
ncbi:MAG: hypothetical protein EAZ97_06905 [Bacteroidetes bacterium]|nr:MAG: hypothetical protein EAZ97_06905 [Bacteroidota bacterium]